MSSQNDLEMSQDASRLDEGESGSPQAAEVSMVSNFSDDEGEEQDEVLNSPVFFEVLRLVTFPFFFYFDSCYDS